ncbi:hypothetical protein L1S35_08040 [Flavobacterium sp. AS60]|uniref:hypothetical protein n=1 Tax=Flavobacterium anseongense TaxID=2910677 RepID=UPI001F2A478B|nr:hypothetical protein [Flavobacterium sp. AS60]MCF6129619.1 hypothetical protein [Flavobacterium sp. AS60]
MKTISKLRMAVVALALACTVPTFASPVTPEPTSISNKAAEDAKTEVLLNRLKEIKDMDKSNLSRAEKKELRKEVKEIKATMKASNNGVYLSVGAIIIIILLLILIL